MKNKSLLLFLLFQLAFFGQVVFPNQNDDAVLNYTKLSFQQLYDTSKYFFNNNNIDTALIFYNLLISKTSIKDSDIDRQKKMIEVYNYTAIIYCKMCDYRTGYEYLIKALLLSDKYNLDSYKAKIYSNIGTIYSMFGKNDITKTYYLSALNYCQDSSDIILILNNFGAEEAKNNNLDSAFFYCNKALQISKRHDNLHLHSVLFITAFTYHQGKLYDSAYNYYHLALDVAQQNNNIEREAKILSHLGNLFFEINKPDSALHYLELSRVIAEKNNFFDTMSYIYQILSQIEESKKNATKALEYYKKYSNLKDSVFNNAKFGEINQLQRLYEVSKTNQQIEQLIIEQNINEKTIFYQKITQQVILTALLIVSIAFALFFLQNKKLRKAYKVLFEKNLKIIKLQEKKPESILESITESSTESIQDNSTESVPDNSTENIQDSSTEIVPDSSTENFSDNSTEIPSDKSKKNVLSDKAQKELINKILSFMKSSSLIFEADFSLYKLSESIQVNHLYVSHSINNVLRKNFRSFLNEYRIQESLRLFSKSDTAIYTIEFVASQVGFKSRTSFRNAFKEIIGVNPNYFIKSMGEQNILTDGDLS